MNENSTHTELLIRYLDGELRGEELDSLKKSLTEHESLRTELENLQLARQAVKRYGLKTKIHALHSDMMQELKENKIPKASIIKMISRNGLRIAVVLVVLVGLSELYQYMSATPEKLFSENYHPFVMHETRGTSNSPLAEAYKKGYMDSVRTKFSSLNSPQPEERLLAGIAYLENNQGEKAIEIFRDLIQINTSLKTDFFEEDAEYYLAMSYLSHDEPGKALPLFEKIHADQNHSYNEKVSEWFLIKIRGSIPKK